MRSVDDEIASLLADAARYIASSLAERQLLASNDPTGHELARRLAAAADDPALLEEIDRLLPQPPPASP